jgi:hypothetical protein
MRTIRSLNYLPIARFNLCASIHILKFMVFFHSNIQLNRISIKYHYPFALWRFIIIFSRFGSPTRLLKAGLALHLVLFFGKVMTF